MMMKAMTFEAYCWLDAFHVSLFDSKFVSFCKYALSISLPRPLRLLHEYYACSVSASFYA